MKKYLYNRIENLFTILFLIIGFVISYFFGSGSLNFVYAAIGFIIALILVELLKFSMYSYYVLPPLKWLYSCDPLYKFAQNLQKRESSISKSSTVFIITDDLTLDSSYDPTIETVRKNLLLGVNYVFIIPNSSEVMHNADIVWNKHKEFESQISINITEEEYIRKITFENIMIIYDPEGLQVISAFLEIPDGSEMWWAEMDPEHSKQAFDNLIRMKKRIRFSSSHGKRLEEILPLAFKG